ncbi:hypothetical protein L226DRAFT_1038 [Lentinus tigrinus ALCF2SS1-7]|uniref:uncharacterized protein n=1 Tax=Lentinus tigrinus ALCF2SS1-7 TaxID=1328758 RepID=UPI00116600C5|nr:hypothetical protein L226DRAFT_1038 [Lentinus tigrinus ALCF2SS1-7]
MRLMDGRGGACVRDGDWLPGSGGRGVRSLSGRMCVELGNGFSWFIFVLDGTFTVSGSCRITYVVVCSSPSWFRYVLCSSCLHIILIARTSVLLLLLFAVVCLPRSFVILAASHTHLFGFGLVLLCTIPVLLSLLWLPFQEVLAKLCVRYCCCVSDLWSIVLEVVMKYLSVDLLSLLDAPSTQCAQLARTRRILPYQ